MAEPVIMMCNWLRCMIKELEQLPQLALVSPGDVAIMQVMDAELPVDIWYGYTLIQWAWIIPV